MKDCKKIFIDIDGVLTNGKFYMDSSGEKPFKAFHSRDIRAIRELVSKGFHITLVTADEWSGSKVYAEKVGAEILFERDKSKVPVDQESIVIGDDVWDIPMMQLTMYSYCPYDADQKVIEFINIGKPKDSFGPGGIIDCEGGNGVIAKFITQYLS